MTLLERARNKAMETAGINVDSVLAATAEALAPLPLAQRTQAVQDAAFWQNAERIAADPDIGARLGRLLPPLRGHVVEYFYSSSRTFGGALVRTLAYQKLVHPSLAIRLVMSAGECYLADESATAHPRHLVECFTGGMIRFLRDASDGLFTPTRIDFMHAAGASDAEYRTLYGCPVQLGCAQTRVYFDAGCLAHEAWHTDLSLQELHERIAEQRLEEIDRRALMDATMRAISQGLDAGRTGIDDIAARLGLTRRQLQVRLEALDTNFNTLLDNYRFDLARHLLKGTDERMETIAALCGFSDVSAFYRAFRRWSGQTPLACRTGAPGA